MIYRILCMLAVSIFLFSSRYAAAIEVLSGQELASHCEAVSDDRDSADGQYCIRYIQGFIDGAVATDARVMINIEAEFASKESYSDRVIRQRAPSRREVGRATRYAEFCLGDPLPLREVVDRIVTDLLERKHLEPEHTARDIVYASLRKHYPCKKSSSEE